MDINNILERLKDNCKEEENTKVVLKADKKVNNQSGFSKDEEDKLYKEMMGSSVIKNEPIFNKSPSKIKSHTQSTQPTEVIVTQNNSEIISAIKDLKKLVVKIDKKIVLTNHSDEVNQIHIDETPQSLEIVKLLVAQTDASPNTIYQLQTKDGIKEITIESYYELSKFISMLDSYQYSMMVDSKLTFKNSKFNNYKNKLQIISNNILANSFKFLKRNSVLKDIILLGENIKKEFSITSSSIDNLEIIFIEIAESFKLPEYQESLYLAKLLNSKGFTLNTITIINEMLGEYLIDASLNLSPEISKYIQDHLDKIEITSRTRKAYFKLNQSTKEFFETNFNQDEIINPTTFFTFKTSKNNLIFKEFYKIYNSNKRNKSQYFYIYTELINSVRGIRNDLAHGNNEKLYNNIVLEIDDILKEFEFICVEKNFLQK